MLLIFVFNYMFFKENEMLGEKKYVKVLLCKSNVKKEATYYSRVNKIGKIGKKELINEVRSRAPYIDSNSFEVGLEVLAEVMLEYLEVGYNVELFGLGTVALKGKGSLKLKEPLQKNIEGVFNNIDKRLKEAKEEEIREKEITGIAKKSISFTLQFSPSRVVKKHVKEHVEPYIITANLRKPKIESIEKVSGAYYNEATSIIKIRGEGIKLVGDGAQLYIKAKDKIIKIEKEAVLQNEPKTLMAIIKIPLKEGEKYSFYLSTQYAKMGNRQTSIIRRCMKDFNLCTKGGDEAERVISGEAKNVS